MPVTGPQTENRTWAYRIEPLWASSDRHSASRCAEKSTPGKGATAATPKHADNTNVHKYHTKTQVLTSVVPPHQNVGMHGDHVKGEIVIRLNTEILKREGQWLHLSRMWYTVSNTLTNQDAKRGRHSTHQLSLSREYESRLLCWYIYGAE
jgi:hypothetical protein